MYYDSDGNELEQDAYWCSQGTFICTVVNLIFAVPHGKSSAKIDEDMKVRVDNQEFPYTHMYLY